MAWVRIDDAMCEHPRVLQAGPVALAMQVAALCYSNRNLTDGFIPRAAAKGLVDLEGVYIGDPVEDPLDPRYVDEHARWAQVVEALVAAGAWEVVTGGWQIHDYGDYQPTRESIESERAQARERMATARARKSARRSEDVRQNTERSSGNPDPDPDPDPDPVEDQVQDPLSTAVDERDHDDPGPPPDDGFDAFWARWPSRHGKKLGRAKAGRSWSRMSLPDRRAAYVGAGHYAAASDAGLAGAKDAFRWLQGREWDEWQEPARPDPSRRGRDASSGTAGKPTLQPWHAKDAAPGADWEPHPGGGWSLRMADGTAMYRAAS